MSENDPVNLAGIPVFTGDLALLDTKVTALTKGAEAISTAAADVHSSFGGLQAFYRAPEADQLFATTKPVADRGLSLKSDLATIAGALSTYSDDAYPLVEKLKELKRDAGAFLVKANADDKWREDGDLVEENNTRHHEITETWAAFQAVERACHAKIVALVGGHALQIDDGSGKKGTYGYDADALKDVKGLPWGDPVKESKPWWHVHEHAWDFVKGFAVDGVWGTVKGLGTLVGTDGWDAAKQAWTGLGKLATGLALSSPATAMLFWTTPDEQLPSWLRDSRNAVKETGKALVAWDQWGENPSRAAGAVTFNVLTTVFTGGTGGAASGAGKAALAAKALSYAGKVGRIVDPMTYVFKGAGMGLTKISDVMAGFKGLDNIEVPTLPQGAITLPDGAFKFADGTLHLPEGAAVPEGAFEVPGNSVKLPDGTEIPAGAIDLGDGVVRLPEGMAPPAGSLRIPEGALKLPEGTTIAPENALKGLDRDGNTVYLDGPGNVLKEDGTLLQHHTAARQESPVSDADSPAAHTSSPQPVLVGAHTVGGNTDNLIRTGDDLGDFGRVGDDATGTDRTPGGSANNLPGGSAGHHMPSGSLDGGGRGSSSADTTSVGGGRGDISNGSTGDSGFTSGHHHPETPGMAGSGAAARASANATPSTGGQAGDGTGVGQSADNAAQLVERTPEEAKRIQDEHVRLANEDPIWRDEHYTAHLHRKNANEIVDGQYLPVLKDVGNGRYVSTSSLPYGPSEKYRLRIENPQLSNIPTDHATKLDGLAEKHLAYKELGVADRAHTKNPTAETAEALQTAKDAFGDTPVNTKVGEALGEASARLHVIQEVFPGAREVTDLPSTANGSRSFDQLYELGNGEFLVVEAKAPSGRLDWRQGAGIDANIQVKQGTLQYLRTIATEMYSRGGRDRELAEQLRIALLDEKIQYVMVQAKHHSGSYAGGELHYFKIFEGETQ